MDSEKLKQFLLPIILLLVTLMGSFSLMPKVSENLQNIKQTQESIAAKMTEIQTKEAQIQEFERKEREEEDKEKQNANKGKPFYRPVMEGLDTEAVIAGEFAEILQLIRANKIKVRSIKYDYDPADDAFVKGAGDKYNVARLNMEMIGNYGNYSNFLREIYKHDHFLDIQTVEIVPYKKNKKVLLINLRLKLYAKK